MAAIESSSGPEWRTGGLGEPISLYVHIPFCRSRCSYCAFNTFTGLDALIWPYVRALVREMELVSAGAGGQIGSAHTLYLGGGTPSLLSPCQVEAVINAAKSCFDLTPDAEISIEVNPGTVDLAKLCGYRAAGVNRVSIGVQSAQPSELILFGRDHSFEEAADAFQAARGAGFDNISVDLIYGAPTQTFSGWRDTLCQVLAWEPDHLSLYSLTLEPQTLLSREVGAGRLSLPDDDLVADMYDDARRHMAHAGFVQYEISNWARAGKECYHNRQYWLNRPFLGFGSGAHGAAGGVRYWNVRHVHEYLSRVGEGAVRQFPFSPALAEYETVDWRTGMAETIILGLRLVQDGLNCVDFMQRFGVCPAEVYAAPIAELTHLGLLAECEGALRLTERAYLISNQVFIRFLPGNDT